MMTLVEISGNVILVVLKMEKAILSAVKFMSQTSLLSIIDTVCIVLIYIYKFSFSFIFA